MAVKKPAQVTPGEAEAPEGIGDRWRSWTVKLRQGGAALDTVVKPVLRSPGDNAAET